MPEPDYLLHKPGDKADLLETDICSRRPSPAFPRRARPVNRQNLGCRKRPVIEAELVHFAFEIEIVSGHRLVGVVAAEPERSRDIEIHQRRRPEAPRGLLDSVDIDPRRLRRQALRHTRHMVPAAVGNIHQLRDRGSRLKGTSAAARSSGLVSVCRASAWGPGYVLATWPLWVKVSK